MAASLYNQLLWINSEPRVYKFPEEPCYCDSGKKFRKCHGGPDRPKRQMGFLVEVPNCRAMQFRLEEDPTGAPHLVLLGDGVLLRPTYAAMALGYQSPTEFRYSLTIPILPDQLPVSVGAALRGFDLLMCIDASWDAEMKRAVSVAIKLKFEEDKIAAVHEVAFDFIEPRANPEAIGLALAATALSTEYPGKKRIGIVTDYNREPQLGVNRRTIPLFGNYYLPANMELIYARDSGSAGIGINGALREANNRAIRLRESLDPGGTQGGWRPAEGHPYKAWRVWVGNYSKDRRRVHMTILDPPKPPPANGVPP